jgi:hydroxylamine reductase
MNYNFHQLNQHEQDECLSKGICSQSPVLISLHEVIMHHLRDLSFYLLELKAAGAENAQLKDQVIDILSSLIINVEYTPEQFKVILDRLHDGLSQAKALYFDICRKKGISAITLPEPPKKGRKFNFSEAIREGQREYKKKSKKFTQDEKLLLEVLFILIKSICIHLVELKSYDFEDTEIYYYILELLKSMSNPQEFEQKQKEDQKLFIALDTSLLRELYELKKQRFGEMVPVDVSFSIRPNKAILVAGENLVDLEAVLKATVNKGIDVYTHGKMIMAHAYPKLKAYPNLVGHFGRGSDSGLVDFAAFPGAIFMTKLSLQRVERLYRSRIFTTDAVAHKGVIIIKDGNYEPLVESALTAKGFEHSQEKHSVRVGFCEKEVIEKITEVSEKMEKNEIKHFFAIGISNGTYAQREYFEKFLSCVPENCFVLSFSYTNECENVLTVPSESGVAILYKALDILSRNKDLSDVKATILYTRCEYHTIPNLLNMSFMGAKDIYFPTCSPHLIKPELVEYIREKYDINSYTNPRSDIQRMLSNDASKN